MKKFVNTTIWIPVIRYALVGGFAYVIEITAIYSLKKSGFTDIVSVAIAFWIGLTASFILQKIIAFKNTVRDKKSLSKQTFFYALLVAFNYCFTLIATQEFKTLVQNLLVARTITLLITTVWNFFIYKNVIFKHATVDNKVNKEQVFTINYYTYISNPIHRTITYITRRPWLFIGLLTLPILVFFIQYLATGNKIITGDFDYSAQLYEAARISILKYGQFPLWNPWLVGGLPLYANPQYGLFSIQTPLTLIFGAIYGLKLAFVLYAIAGFWGMYFLGKKVVGATSLRSALVSYIWIFCGFFSGHNISHFTFAGFFLLPWFIYLIYQRREKWSWLWFALLESLIILSAIHYAFLLTAVAVVLYFFISLMSLKTTNKKLSVVFSLERNDILFILKSTILITVLCANRFIMTYTYMSGNARDISTTEIYPTIKVIVEALFLPINTLIHHAPPHLQWSWGEYSMYMGLGVTFSLLIIAGVMIKDLFTKRSFSLSNRRLIIPLLIVGFIGVMLALGDFGKLSPYHILHSLPGFTQTRVPSRWLIVTVFSLLVFLMVWQKNQRLITTLLFLSTVELFLTYGPPTNVGAAEYTLPKNSAAFPSVITEYNNGKNHLDMQQHVQDSYFYSTERNVGQIYADDSVVNTLNQVYLTTKCAENTDKNCSFVMSGNAKVLSWSPNKVVIRRIGHGSIELDMNVQAGWRVNGSYVYAGVKHLDPMNSFYLPNDGSETYTLEYAPKFSLSWLSWKLQQIF